ncbi:hypothetical protein [Maribacter sp. 2304DJ31-5]|uniref:hypothetical protein n=1 Tax=Maribacter sp. 2304DJ31-5 TaxID=3386273 RepID=UPI0039BCE4AE
MTSFLFKISKIPILGVTPFLLISNGHEGCMKNARIPMKGCSLETNEVWSQQLKGNSGLGIGFKYLDMMVFLAWSLVINLEKSLFLQRPEILKLK